MHWRRWRWQIRHDAGLGLGVGAVDVEHLHLYIKIAGDLFIDESELIAGAPDFRRRR